LFPYWILFSVYAAGAVQYRPDARRPIQGGPLLLVVALFTALMVGFRYQVGGDWLNYLRIFGEISSNDLAATIRMSDPGYTVLNWLASQLDVGMWFINIICGAIFTWGLARFVREQPNPWLAGVVAVPYLIIVVAMGYTRQAVAMGLILAGLVSLRHRQSIVRFGLYVAVAALFHKSAIIILPLAAFASTRNRLGTLLITALLGFILYYLFVEARIDTMMRNYVTQEYDSSGAGVRIAMNLVPATLLLIFPRRFGLNEFEGRLWRNFALASWAALVILFALNSSTVVDRLALYLIPLQLLVYSRVPYAFSRQQQSALMLTLLVIGYSALVQFIWLTSAVNASYWIPYKFYIFA
jgi:hypothetical protein